MEGGKEISSGPITRAQRNTPRALAGRKARPWPCPSKPDNGSGLWALGSGVASDVAGSYWQMLWSVGMG